MPKSQHAIAVDAIQTKLRPMLKQYGYKARGRTFNRLTDDGLTQVINIQMGAADPPGTAYIANLRENLHGLFCINLGIHVPEVAEIYNGGKPKSWIQEYDCCVRSRLGEAGGKDSWWPATASDTLTTDLIDSLKTDGFGFLGRYASRDSIIQTWDGRTENLGASSPPRIVLAIILARRGELEQAKQLLNEQISVTKKNGHREFVQTLAGRLGLED